ncbi:uncharacterized protein LOC107857737 [Capsicum annuum]|uniref:uncharacterized protein LOC107857737 n=1 Tax=Capsicum annuum TaxID=4072 RepID=UPI0007BF541C|nr:uncharacterized protein LOC107857737 [Capsicum annuum]
MVVDDDVHNYDTLFGLMAKSHDAEDDKVTLLDIKNNLKNYSLATMLVDTVNELTKDNECLNKNIDKCEEEVVELTVQVTELQQTGKLLSLENDLLNEKAKRHVPPLKLSPKPTLAIKLNL